ncbi:hypothetical protein SAY87_007902 [Trapa incisa]|uniref:Uncharacterized protein n=1 Tax=Trapa incisa TaxID=236973 RepID=A0AAN7KFX9_9MYRT|nr:hypothetical protein SAY87_007902 [Trapa incisa]
MWGISSVLSSVRLYLCILKVLNCSILLFVGIGAVEEEEDEEVEEEAQKDEAEIQVVGILLLALMLVGLWTVMDLVYPGAGNLLMGLPMKRSYLLMGEEGTPTGQPVRFYPIPERSSSDQRSAKHKLKPSQLGF